jgi:hypothetical protein
MVVTVFFRIANPALQTVKVGVVAAAQTARAYTVRDEWPFMLVGDRRGEP